MKIFPLRPMSTLDILNNFIKIVSKDKKLPDKAPKTGLLRGFDVNKRGYLA